MSISYFIKYPFTKEAIEYLKNLEIDIFSLLEEYPEVLDAAVENIEKILDEGEYSSKKMYPSDEVLVYPTTKMLIEIINNDFLRFKFADVMSKRTQNFLSKEKNELLQTIAINTFQWNVKFEDLESNGNYDCKIKFNDFLPVAPRDSKWKLINRRFEDGWVFLKKRELVRLVSEKIKKDIVEKPLKAKEIPKLPDFIEERVNLLREKAQKYKRTVDLKITGAIVSNQATYPPCIREILTKLKKGENLDHTSRLVFLFFFLSIGKSVQDVVDLFRAQPDFNEERTTYYVEHAAGMRGSGTQYSSYGCAKINTYGLCKAEQDLWCQTRDIKNPLEYFRRKNWKIQNVIIPKILTYPFLIRSRRKYYLKLKI